MICCRTSYQGTLLIDPNLFYSLAPSRQTLKLQCKMAVAEQAQQRGCPQALESLILAYLPAHGNT